MFREFAEQALAFNASKIATKTVTSLLITANYFRLFLKKKIQYSPRNQPSKKTTYQTAAQNFFWRVFSVLIKKNKISLVSIWSN